MEIGSYSVKLGVVFLKRIIGKIWQTSDPKLLLRNNINPWIEYENLTKKMIQSFEIDIDKIPWKISLRSVHSLQGIVSLNMIQIAK